MAPALLDTLPTPLYQGKKSVDTNIFPDGIKTSGQHPPQYDLLRPYSDFPKVCSGPALWKPEDYRNNPERWIHRFTPEEIEELGSVADKYIADGLPLTGISKASLLFVWGQVVPNRSRATLSFRSSGSFWQRLNTTFWKAKDSYFSKGFQSKNGTTISVQLHTWGSALT